MPNTCNFFRIENSWHVSQSIIIIINVFFNVLFFGANYNAKNKESNSKTN